MIHFTHVTKSYEANWKALNNVTFRINKGEFVFLTGHSGGAFRRRKIDGAETHLHG